MASASVPDPALVPFFTYYTWHCHLSRTPLRGYTERAGVVRGRGLMSRGALVEPIGHDVRKMVFYVVKNRPSNFVRLVAAVKPIVHLAWREMVGIGNGETAPSGGIDEDRLAKDPIDGPLMASSASSWRSHRPTCGCLPGSIFMARVITGCQGTMRPTRLQ